MLQARGHRLDVCLLCWAVRGRFSCNSGVNVFFQPALYNLMLSEPSRLVIRDDTWIHESVPLNAESLKDERQGEVFPKGSHESRARARQMEPRESAPPG